MEASARWHVDHLRQRLAVTTVPAVRSLADGIIAMTNRALRERSRLSSERMPVTLGGVCAALKADRAATMTLLNEHALGLGSQAPLTVFIGKEHAYDETTAPVNFAVEAIALSALWLTAPSRRLLAAVLEAPALDIDFLRRPAMLPLGTIPLVASRAGHTWHKVARVLQHHLGTPVTYQSWGDHAYLVELNTAPSKEHVGLAPSEVRIEFLCELARVFRRGGTRSLVFHSQEQHHRDAQARITAAFLGVDVSSLSEIGRVARDAKTPGKRIEAWEHGDARVVRCRQLSNSIGDDLLRDVAALLVDRVPPLLAP